MASEQMPGLPEPQPTAWKWTEAELQAIRAYGLLCAKWALERAAEKCDDQEEPPYYGHENPNTFNDGKWACASAIRDMAKEMQCGS